MLIGFLSVGYYGYVQSETCLFQAYQSWRLDQLQQGSPASIALYLKQWIGIAPRANSGPPEESQELKGSRGRPELEASNSETRGPQGPIAAFHGAPGGVLKNSEGSLLGRIKIPSLNLSAIILEGVQPATLRLAVGHLPGSPLPGEAGTIDLAAHRDTFFRGLRNVKRGDLITLSTVRGATFEYRVESLAVVSPNNTDVLNGFPGPGVNLITCYPFYYVGAAPRRFVVHAVEVNDSAGGINGVRTDTGGKKGDYRSSSILPASFNQRSSSSLPAHKSRTGGHKKSSRFSQDPAREISPASPAPDTLKAGEDSTSFSNASGLSSLTPHTETPPSQPVFNRVKLLFRKLFKGGRSPRPSTPLEASAGA